MYFKPGRVSSHPITRPLGFDEPTKLSFKPAASRQCSIRRHAYVTLGVTYKSPVTPRSQPSRQRGVGCHTCVTLGVTYKHHSITRRSQTSHRRYASVSQRQPLRQCRLRLLLRQCRPHQRHPVQRHSQPYQPPRSVRRFWRRPGHLRPRSLQPLSPYQRRRLRHPLQPRRPLWNFPSALAAPPNPESPSNSGAAGSAAAPSATEAPPGTEVQSDAAASVAPPAPEPPTPPATPWLRPRCWDALDASAPVDHDRHMRRALRLVGNLLIASSLLGAVGVLVAMALP